MNILDKVMKKLTTESIITEDGKKITSWKETDGCYHQPDVTLNLKDAKIVEATYDEYIGHMRRFGYEYSRKILSMNDVEIDYPNKIVVECNKGKYSIRGDKQRSYVNGYKVFLKLFNSENKELDNNIIINIKYDTPTGKFDVKGNNNNYSTFSNGLFRFGQGLEINEKTHTLTFTISDDKFVIDKEKSTVLIECDEFIKK